MRLSPRRPGTVLLLFALIVFALLGLAALVIDLGLARVSQRQMQAAADTAALEGLRFRDELPPEVDPMTAPDRDVARREAARRAVFLMFEDTGGRAYGAAPDIPLVAGVNPLQATIDRGNFPAPRRFYKPDLQLNEGDEGHGDMVAGTFHANGTNPNFDPGQPYRRADFAPQPNGDAFLARLRLTNDRDGLDDHPGTSSRGPTVPYLFGRATLLAQQTRDAGITVRATAIADARPVLSAGLPLTVPGLAEPVPGVAPYGLSLASWNAWRQDETNRTATTLTLTVQGGDITGPVTGRFTDPPIDLVTVGAAFPAAAGRRDVLAHERYVRIYAPVAGQDRVAGFLHLRVAAQSDTTLTVDILLDVAARNATGALAGPLPPVGTDADVNALFALNASILDPLRAPALVNRHLGPTP